jgi:hypothetical protein
MAQRLIISIMILTGIGIVVSIIYFITIFYAFAPDKDYSITDLKNNFEKNKTEIYALKKYFNEIVPKNRFVEIEFEDDNTLGRFGIRTLDVPGENSVRSMFLEWNLKINTEKMGSIIKPLGWTRETLKALKAKLDKANCIQIESGEPAKIGFKRSGMGMYSFNVFDKAVPDSLKAIYNDSCTYILADDNLVLEYGGGAVGSQCFYNMK